MKRSWIASHVAASALMFAMIGCSGPTDTAQTDAPAATEQSETTDTVPGDGEGVTLVSLKVPNMH